MTNKTNWLSRRMWLSSVLGWGSICCLQLLTLLGSSDVSYLRQWVEWTASSILPLVVATPLLFHFCQQIVLHDLSRRRPWAVLAAIVVCMAAVHALVVLLWRNGSVPGAVFVSFVLSYAFQYGTVAALAVAVNQHQLAEVRRRELLAAQLSALRAQLQPHFLFNTLHAISVTGRTDSGAATRMITLLGDLLRLTLRERTSEFVTLAEEQELLRPYLELQKLRFPDRLRIELDFPEDVLAAAVPDLLLQPLVENALEHGLEQRPEGGSVRIAARRFTDRLEIQVRDDGAGPAAGAVRMGVGLGTTKARLHALFGAAATVTLAPAPGGGAVTTVTLPWREVARAA